MRSGAKGLSCQVVPALNMKYLGGMICLILTPHMFVLDFLMALSIRAHSHASRSHYILITTPLF